MAIKNRVAYKFPEKCNWKVFDFNGKVFKELLKVKAEDIEADGWTVIDEDITTLHLSVWVFVREADEINLSPMKHHDGTDYADVYAFKFPQDEAWEATQIVMQRKLYEGGIPGTAKPKPMDFDYGPNSYANRYSTLRDYFFVGHDDKNVVVW